MHINPVKVSFNGFAILFKILSAHCDCVHLYRILLEEEGSNFLIEIELKMIQKMQMRHSALREF